MKIHSAPRNIQSFLRPPAQRWGGYLCKIYQQAQNRTDQHLPVNQEKRRRPPGQRPDPVLLVDISQPLYSVKGEACCEFPISYSRCEEDGRLLQRNMCAQRGPTGGMVFKALLCTKSPGNGKHVWFWASVTKILLNDKHLGYA